jgi:hypothetical protein
VAGFDRALGLTCEKLAALRANHEALRERQRFVTIVLTVFLRELASGGTGRAEGRGQRAEGNRAPSTTPTAPSTRTAHPALRTQHRCSPARIRPRQCC